MATQNVEVELQEVRIDISAATADPAGLSGRTPDDDNTVGGYVISAVDFSGRTPEDVLEELEKAIEYDRNDMKSLNQYLAELVKLLRDDNTVGVRPAASRALCYATWAGSIPIMDTLIQKGADINTKSNVLIGWRAELTPLHVAAFRDNAETVTFLVDKGADINIKDANGETPLHWAACFGKFDAVRILSEKGADVNIKDRLGRTALHRPAKDGNIDIVRCLSDKGTDADIKNDNGKTPLHEAASTGRVDVVRCLGDKGADVNIRDNDGNTPLHLAVQSGCYCFKEEYLDAQRHYVDAVTYLVGKGADVSIRNHLGKTPLHEAASAGFIDIMRCLSDKPGADINIKDNSGNTPLHLASLVKEGHLDAVTYLVGKGADVNVRNYFGSTPLHIATMEDHKDIVKFLVDHGADVNMKDGKDVLEDLKKAIQDGDVELFNQRLSLVEELFQDHDSTVRGLATSGALCYATRARSIPMMDTLIKKGVDVNTKSNIEIEIYDGCWGTQEWTPLLEAAKSGKVGAVKYLVEKGADVNIRGHGKSTPLLEAARSGKVDTVKYLVEKGAHVNIKDDSEVSCLHEAVESANLDMVRYLGDNGADVAIKGKGSRTPLHKAAERGKVDLVRYFVGKGADVNIKDKDGLTPLHLAAHHGKFDTVKYLVEKGADVDTKGYEDRTPLYFAAEIGNMDLVRYLCDKGADHNIKSDHGWTLLHYAARLGNVDVVRYLVDKVADVNIKDNNGATPLHLACHYGNAEAVKCLLEKEADPGNSLSTAISLRHKDIAALLLGHDKWEEMLDSTLVRELIVFMPDVAEVAFNRCVTTNEGKIDDFTQEQVQATSDTFTVSLNYKFLEDFQDKHSSDSAEPCRPKKFTKNDHPLNLIREHDCSNLLKHPLVISLLEHKWTRFGRYIFFGNLFIYLIFLAFLTAFGLVVLSPLEKTCVDVLNGSFNGTAPENCEGLSIHEYRFLYVGAAVTILTALLRLALEIFQLGRNPLEYLQDWVNWLEIPLYLFSIIFTFVFATPCLCVHSWQWQIGVVAVFLVWVGLITFLQKWPVTGVYVLMFVNILGSFMKIAFLALLLVIAFALAFYMLLFEPDEMRTAFSNPGRAIVKVMAMTTGELDYDDLYHQQEGEDEIAFPPVSFLLWIIFLVLMPVLLSNLLVGLAVGDVDHLQKTANENRIGLQIDLVLSFEELLDSLGIRHRFAIKSKTCYPNMPATLLPEWCKKGSNDFQLVYSPKDHKLQTRMGRWYSKLWITDEYSTSGVKISDAIKPPLESLEKQLQMQRQQLEAKMRKQGDHMESQLKEQSEQLKEQSEHFEAKLNQHSEKQSEQFQEAVRQLSESHKESLEKQLQMQHQQMQKQGGHIESQSEQLKEQIGQFEAKLNQHSEKQSEQFQEAVRQLSECHKESLEKQLQMQHQQMQKQGGHMESQLKEQSEQLKEQSGQLKERIGQFEAKLNQHSEKQSEQFQEAVKQLSECHKEQAKQSEEQVKKMEEKTEQLAGEVASLREALEKLVTHMAAK